VCYYGDGFEYVLNTSLLYIAEFSIDAEMGIVGSLQAWYR